MLKNLLLILLLIKFSFPAVSGKQAITDTLSFSSLNTFVTNLGDSVVAWELKKSRPLTANLVIPKTQTFSIAKGIHLDLAGYTITIKNGEKFGDSAFVGSSGTVVFDTCSVTEVNTYWKGSAGIVFVWNGCSRDTSKVTTLKAGTAGIGSLATTTHINDSTYARTERITGKSYAQGGYNGNLTGVSDSSVGAKRVENGVYTNVLYNNPNYINSLAGNKITGAVSTANVATSANTATNLNGGYVNATTGTFGGNVTAPSATITAMTSTNNVSDSSKSRSASTDNMYIAGSKVKTVAIVNGSYLLMDELYDFILGSATGFIFGSNSTGLAIYNNRIQDRGGNSQITGFKLAEIDSIYNRIIISQIIHSAGDLELTAAGDLTVDIAGVTNWYSTGNMNFESTDGEVNIQSDASDVHIASYNGDVSIGGDTIILNGVVRISDKIVKARIDTVDFVDTISALNGEIANLHSGYATIRNRLDVHTVEVANDLTVHDRIYHPLDVLTSYSTYNMTGTADLTAHPYSYWEIVSTAYNTWQFYNCPVGTVIYVRNTTGISQYIELTTGQSSTDKEILPGELWQLVCVATGTNVTQWQAFKSVY